MGPDQARNPSVIRIHLMRLQRKLGEDGGNPKYTFAEPLVGYQMEWPDIRAGAQGQE